MDINNFDKSKVKPVTKNTYDINFKFQHTL